MKQESIMQRNLTQALCDQYLRCPVCLAEKTLRLDEESNRVACDRCATTYSMRNGIPALMHKDEIGTNCQAFLGLDNCGNKTVNPYTVRKRNIFHLLLGEVLYSLIAVLLVIRHPRAFWGRLHRWCTGRNWSDPVNRALYYGWTNYFNLVLKSGEIAAFNKMGKYISEPSLEIGCGSCETTNMIFRDRMERVTFGCEYFMDNYLSSPEEMYKVIKHYVGGSIQSLPFTSGVLSSVYMVHIIDHIIETDTWFREIHRILKPGGYLVFDGYSNNAFEHLPGARLRRVFSSKWANKYEIRRATRENPYRGGIPLQNTDNFYATGQNILAVSEWAHLAEANGFSLVEHAFFAGGYFPLFMDLEYRGYFPSLIASHIIYCAIDMSLERERAKPLSEAAATNVILVFQKN